MMDSTPITLFDNILKGVGRHPKSGKKKGGMKVHTVMKYHVGVPMVVQLTSAAKHDHYLLKEVHLPKDSTLAMDRGYMGILPSSNGLPKRVYSPDTEVIGPIQMGLNKPIHFTVSFPDFTR